MSVPPAGLRTSADGALPRARPARRLVWQPPEPTRLVSGLREGTPATAAGHQVRRRAAPPPRIPSVGAPWRPPEVSGALPPGAGIAARRWLHTAQLVTYSQRVAKFGASVNINKAL